MKRYVSHTPPLSTARRNSCPTCGARPDSACKQHGKPIRGKYHIDRVRRG